MKQINLNQREKYVVVGAVCFIVIFLVSRLLVYPILEKQERLSRALTVKSTALMEMRALQTEYFAIQKKAELARKDLGKRSKDFSLFSYLDSLVGDIGIKGNVSYMKPSTTLQKDTNAKISTVELKLQAITMEQLSKYLYQVEYSGNNLYVKRMSISETSRPEGFLDVVLQVETIEA